MSNARAVCFGTEKAGAANRAPKTEPMSEENIGDAELVVPT